MTDAPSLEALMAAQVAAEDAVLAQGLEVWSVADPDAGEVVLHMTPNDLLPRGGMQDASGSNPDALTGTVGSSPTGAANADGTKLTRVHDLAQALRRVAGGSMDWIWDAIFDMEALVEGKHCIVVQTADEWIADGERWLVERAGRRTNTAA